jgi:biopolymer transport protein ExbD
MAKRDSALAGKVPVDMTPMIDVVFQLLTFFMLTLRTVVVEGDFNIRMPLGVNPINDSDTEPPSPIIVKMTATPEGHLSDVRLGDKSAAGPNVLSEVAQADAMFDTATRVGHRNGHQLAAARDAKQAAAEKLVASLQKHILDAVGNDLAVAEHTELELDCDPALEYDHVICAITAASGIVQGDTVVPLIQKIKFTPPTKAK